MKIQSKQTHVFLQQIILLSAASVAICVVNLLHHATIGFQKIYKQGKMNKPA